jgi:hypothetical protein
MSDENVKISLYFIENNEDIMKNEKLNDWSLEDMMLIYRYKKDKCCYMMKDRGYDIKKVVTG